MRKNGTTSQWFCEVVAAIKTCNLPCSHLAAPDKTIKIKIFDEYKFCGKNLFPQQLAAAEYFHIFKGGKKGKYFEHMVELNKLTESCQFYTRLWWGKKFVLLIVESVPGQQIEWTYPKPFAKWIWSDQKIYCNIGGLECLSTGEAKLLPSNPQKMNSGIAAEVIPIVAGITL